MRASQAFAAVLLLVLVAPAVNAQADASQRMSRGGSVLELSARPSLSHFSTSRTASVLPPQLEVVRFADARRPWWRYPLVGAGIGGVAGYAFGAYEDNRCEPDIPLCGAARMINTAAGITAGAIVGLVTHWLLPK